MPIYEYECEQCGKVITIYQPHNARPVRPCPGCLADMKRIMSKNTFHLKGGGWFQEPPKPPKKEDNNDC
jgi:putative FmdB family regulatory protein